MSKAITTTDTLGYPATSNKVANMTRAAATLRTFVHDAGGNITSDTRSGTAYAYTYNKRNRLNTVTVAGSLKGTYTYNAKEQLSIRVTSNMTPSGTTHFIHDLNGNVIAETAGNGPTGATGTVREYIYLPETEIAPAADGRTRVDRPLAVVNAVNTATPATYYVHVDHLNRPVMMTDSTKAQVWAATWQAWGGSYSITGPQANDMRFPGQWFQLESGLHYNWHRHYDPSIGRYTQPDPLGFVDGPSVFGYALSAPQEYFDPNGEQVSRRGGPPRTPSGWDPYGRMDFRRGGIGPVQLGRQGEQAVRNQCVIGNPRGFRVNGRDRISDGTTETTISEIKNTAKNNMTQQIRDYVDYARSTDRQFDYYYRPDSARSRQFQDQVDKGRINPIPIPQSRP